MIITISREFGSGGRELGKRLSEELGIRCYDKEIIQMIAKECEFDEQYVSHVSEKSLRIAYPLTIGHRFARTPNDITKQAVTVAVEQQRIIENLAKQGDCIIIGRCADVILKDCHPFNIFVYADREAKLQRCVDHAKEGENLTLTELERNMRTVDRNRIRHRDFYTDTKWGANENFHLCVNTSGVEIKKLVPVLANYIRMWFGI